MIYFFILLLLAYWSAYRNRSAKLIYLPFLVLFLFSAFRVDAGYDYGSYVQVLNSGFYLFLFEPVPLILGFISNFLENSQIFFILTAGFLLLGLYFFLKKEQQKFLFLILYFSLPLCFLDSFSIVRQFLAASFILIAYSLFSRNKLLSLFFFVLTAFAHKTALVAILPLIVLLISYKFFAKFLYLFALPIIILISSSVYFLVPRLDYFNNIDISGAYGIKGAIFWLVLTLPFIAISKKYQSAYNDPILSITIIGLGLFAGLSFYGYFVTRIFVFFAPFATLFIARSIEVHFKKYSTKVAFLVSTLSLSMALYGASSNADFDFLNNYKIYPSECSNCNIRLEEDF